MENSLNTYKKYCPNVFVAKCPEQHEKGETIVLTTKYGKEHECIVFNQVGKDKDGSYYYSIVRADGYNAQERAKAKAERLGGYAANAEKRSTEAFKKADMSEEATGIPFGQPILVGHHSERRHRKTIERADNAMRKSIEEDKKADEYRRRAEYWEDKANEVNLSMPESLEFYEYKLEAAKKHHQLLKDKPELRDHSYSLTYAKKAVNEAQKNVELAVKLWGSGEEIEQIHKEKEEEAKKKIKNKTGFDALLEQYGGFWFFGSDGEAFKAKYNKLKEDGFVEDGEKVCHIVAGLYIPVKHKDEFIKAL
tara:strand:+ start:7599 stop:8519 length:921 start_codon:yes stop_codon:yes gene_type:complete